MSDKILYSPTEGTTGFWGLRGVRMKPRECPGRGFCSCDDPPVKRCEVLAWEDEMESCKSNKLEIVNPEVIGLTEDSMNQCLHIKGKYLKPGDIFDLPSNYEFKEEFSHCYTLGENHYVLRLVKTETKDLLSVLNKKADQLDSEHRARTTFTADQLQVKVGPQPEPEDKKDCKCTGPWDCKCDDILDEFYYGNQPEPEESQTPIFDEMLRKYFDYRYHREMSGHQACAELQKEFIIQRKKK